jgi:hypothetical protein
MRGRLWGEVGLRIARQFTTTRRATTSFAPRRGPRLSPGRLRWPPARRCPRPRLPFRRRRSRRCLPPRLRRPRRPGHPGRHHRCRPRRRPLGHPGRHHPCPLRPRPLDRPDRQRRSRPCPRPRRRCGLQPRPAAPIVPAGAAVGGARGTRHRATVTRVGHVDRRIGLVQVVVFAGLHCHEGEPSGDAQPADPAHEIRVNRRAGKKKAPRA